MKGGGALPLALVLLIGGFLLIYAGFKGVDPREEAIAAFRGRAPGGGARGPRI